MAKKQINCHAGLSSARPGLEGIPRRAIAAPLDVEIHGNKLGGPNILSALWPL